MKNLLSQLMRKLSSVMMLFTAEALAMSFSMNLARTVGSNKIEINWDI